MSQVSTGLTLEELCEYKKALQEAIFSGAKRVKHNDRETEFQSVSQMERALANLDRQINALSGHIPCTVITPTPTY